MSDVSVGNWELGEVLGTADFDCRVRKCKNIITGGEFAVKIYSKELLSESQWMWDQLAEAIQVLRSLPKNDHIVEMVECFETESHLYILMPYVRSASLYNVFRHGAEGARMTLDRKRFLFDQVIRGVLHMHKHGVAHLGIAPDHILVGQSEVKLSFLVACKTVSVNVDGEPEKINAVCGTTHTVAPEILRQVSYDPFAADVWSCGVVLYFLLHNGRYPFEGANTTKHILHDRRRPCDPSLPPEARELIERMMSYRPEDRPTIKDVAAHPWLVGKSKSIHAEVSWNESKTGLRIKIPPGLSTRDHAALVIQGAWKFLRQRQNDEALNASSSETKVTVIPVVEAPPEDAPMDTAGVGTALEIAKRKWANSKWSPHPCTHCGNLPRQRVRPGVDPYPMQDDAIAV